MKRKILLGILSLLVVGTTVAQDKGNKAKPVFKNVFLSERMPADRVEAGDKRGVLLLSAFVTADEGKGWVVDHLIDMALAKTNVNFYLQYTALVNAKVRFYITLTGPSFHQYYFETWQSIGLNKQGLMSLSFQQTLPFKKGTYRVIWIAEQGGAYSGAESVAECNVRFY